MHGKDIPAAEAKVDFKRLQLPKPLKIELTKGSIGLIGGTTTVTGHGKSVGALLASADGTFGLIMSDGQISKLMLDIIGLDGARILKLLIAGDKNANIRCAVSDFDIKKGIMTSKVFVIDTTETNIIGGGWISLVDETIHLKISPQPKHISVLSLRTPCISVALSRTRPCIRTKFCHTRRLGSSAGHFRDTGRCIDSADRDRSGRGYQLQGADCFS